MGNIRDSTGAALMELINKEENKIVLTKNFKMLFDPVFFTIVFLCHLIIIVPFLQFINLIFIAVNKLRVQKLVKLCSSNFNKWPFPLLNQKVNPAVNLFCFDTICKANICGFLQSSTPFYGYLVSHVFYLFLWHCVNQGRSYHSLAPLKVL